MKKLILSLFFLVVSFFLQSQIYNPVKWSYSQKDLGNNEVELQFTATIESGWHLYSTTIPEGGPIATAFDFFENENIQLVGGIFEPSTNLHKENDPNFDMVLSWFENKATFTQKVKVLAETQIKGELTYMVCDDSKCLPPEYKEFSFDVVKKAATKLTPVDESSNTEIKTEEKKIETLQQAIEEKKEKVENIKKEEASSQVKVATNDSIVKTPNIQNKKVKASIIPSLSNVDLQNPKGNCGTKNESRDIWMVFLFGFLGGLIALLTPCVFPMIPLTVSFFTKDSHGLGKAILYGFFIFAIYAALSIPFHFNADPEVLSEIATSVWLNITFFVVFLFFAFSFFGFYELTLPSSLTTKTDSASNAGGILGVFFMALTLALVSFSCTGPILGTVLGSSLQNGPWPITAAMSGFGIALGLPFGVFAMFPSLMKNLPKSGGWLNSVKVVLGFVELALALKFLSNADLVQQWNILHRETFFLIWIIIGLGLVLYLVGIIKFPHDNPIKGYSKMRVLFITLFASFTIYLIPGVMKNPTWNHDLLSGFPPPDFYSWYEKETFHAEFDDFDLALAEAKKHNKPLLIDFTGWACVNCRKMEETVWKGDKVKKMLHDDFVLVSLYVDDKVELPKEQQGTFEFEINGEKQKKRIKTIGNKWATFQTQAFQNNSQPYYVMLSPEGELLGNPIGYTPNEKEYEDYLLCGLNANKE
jgi:thiol:disulfide interchange protein DsbD